MYRWVYIVLKWTPPDSRKPRHLPVRFTSQLYNDVFNRLVLAFFISRSRRNIRYIQREVRLVVLLLKHGRMRPPFNVPRRTHGFLSAGFIIIIIIIIMMIVIISVVYLHIVSSCWSLLKERFRTIRKEQNKSKPRDSVR